MSSSNERVMYYHGDATPIGGFLTHPFESILETQASVSLGQAGGHSATRHEEFKLDELIRSGAHYSQVTGSVEKTNGNWTTLITSVVENLNVLEVVTADRIVSRISLEHPRAEGKYYPKISFAGTQFENLRINGQVVDVVTDLNLLSSPDAKQVPPSGKEGDMLSDKAAPEVIEFPDVPWPDVPSFILKAVAQSTAILSPEVGAPEWLKRRYEWMLDPAARARKGYIACSLVTAARGTGSNPAYGHVVAVEGFGNIFLGELIVSQQSFHATMLRIELGCSATGNVSFASARGNGFPMP
jgi:hypothetical protein